MKKKQPKLEITELFGAKAGKKGWDRFFIGTLTRQKDEQDNDVLFSKIVIKRYGFNEVICSGACDPGLNQQELQDKLGNQLDELVLMVLDYGLANKKAVIEKGSMTDMYLN